MPTITSINPVFASTTGETSITITGTGFEAGTNVFFGKMDFSFGTDIDVESATSLTVTVPAMPIASYLYDVVVQNDDLQAATLQDALTILPNDSASLINVAGLTSLYSDDSPIYDVSVSSGGSLRKKRIFGLGTNVEVLHYSGRDEGGGLIFNVQRKQLGTTSTRHAIGDLVFKGIASVHAAPFMYKTTGDGIANIDCLIRSNGRIDMHLKKADGTNFVDDSSTLYASYQATVVKSVPPMPRLKIGEEECL